MIFGLALVLAALVCVFSFLGHYYRELHTRSLHDIYTIIPNTALLTKLDGDIQPRVASVFIPGIETELRRRTVEPVLEGVLRKSVIAYIGGLAAGLLIPFAAGWASNAIVGVDLWKLLNPNPHDVPHGILWELGVAALLLGTVYSIESRVTDSRLYRLIAGSDLVPGIPLRVQRINEWLYMHGVIDLEMTRLQTEVEIVGQLLVSDYGELKGGTPPPAKPDWDERITHKHFVDGSLSFSVGVLLGVNPAALANSLWIALPALFYVVTRRYRDFNQLRILHELAAEYRTALLRALRRHADETAEELLIELDRQVKCGPDPSAGPNS